MGIVVERMMSANELGRIARLSSGERPEEEEDELEVEVEEEAPLPPLTVLKWEAFAAQLLGREGELTQPQ